MTLHLSDHEIKCNLTRDLLIHTLLFPGRWMSEIQLSEIKSKIADFTINRIGDLPKYGIFLSGREVWKNRIITMIYEGKSGLLKGFSAMVYCQVNVGNTIYPVLHLGLVVLDRHHSVQHLLLRIYCLPIIYFSFLKECKSTWISSVSMEPSIIGAVADYFDHTYPHYLVTLKPDKKKIEIANSFIAVYGNEFGIGPNSIFQEKSFVIEGSCRGPSDVLRVDFNHAARYIEPACNEFCKRTLNYERGDELLQIGLLSPMTIFRAPFTFREILKHSHRK
jgi:hypothetical protein